ncbi:MAG: alternative cytochrome c oxidase polypeptide CoxN [Rickettsiales bacterium]|nr:alternative cytochrome c oxidase polypeptide CoxN [Rickettsiales bacterium]
MKKKLSIFKLLSQKPWDTEQVKIDNYHDGATLNLTNGKFGLRYLMVISTILFCLFIVTYSDRLVYPDWKKMPEPILLWLNTLLLFISSGVFVSAQRASKNNLFEIVRKRLILIGWLSLAFLVGQLIVWAQFYNLGYYISSNPANAYFYVFTTLHGLHLLGGLIYWIMTIKKVWVIHEIEVIKAKHTIELCSIYWHFLLAVWIVLFGLMLFT